jgi:hypothetical protein
MVDKWCIGNNLEENDCFLTDVLSLFCLEGVSKTTKNLSQDNRYSSWNSNRDPPEYKSKTLMLDRPAQFLEENSGTLVLDDVLPENVKSLLKY